MSIQRAKLSTKNANSFALKGSGTTFFRKVNKNTFFSPSALRIQSRKTETGTAGYEDGLIQRDGPTNGSSSSSPPANTPSQSRNSATNNNTSFNPIADLVRSQLTDAKLRGHLNSLGQALQELAVENTTDADRAGDRLIALGVSRAFTNTANAILQDRDLRNIRRAVRRISRTNPEVILAGAIASVLALSAAGVGIPLRGSPEADLGHGASVGGAFDLGTLTEPEFRRIQLAAGIARTYFAARVTQQVRRVEGEEGEEDRNVGEATGELRIGSRTTGLTGRLQMDTEGRLMLEGQLSIDPFEPSAASRRRRDPRRYTLQFTTGVRYQREPGEEGEVTIRPGLRGDFRIDANQRLRLGAAAVISTQSGLEGLNGSVEYSNRRLFIRVDGNVSGIPDERSIAPGRDMRLQGTFGVRFDL